MRRPQLPRHDAGVRVEKIEEDDTGPSPSLCAASLFVIAARQTFVRYHTTGYLVHVFTPEV